CYCVSECTGTNQGIMVIDMSALPASVQFIKSVPTSNLGSVTSHNLSIDSVAGYLYVEGFGGFNTAIFVFDISTPTDPQFVTGFGPVSSSVHDMYADKDTIYVAEGGLSSFSIWDIANKTNPTLLSRIGVPGGGFLHNIWPTDDRRHVVTTEETPFHTIKVWNMEDLANITLVGEYIAGSQLAHNAQMKGDTLYVSHYESGARVVDISTPSSPREIAAFDTFPFETPSFNGAWGVYPYSPNGYVYASNDDGRLFIFQEEILIIDETMFGDSINAEIGSQVRFDISVSNSRPIHLMNIPFSWPGPSDMLLDSVSKVGTRTESFETLARTSINPFASEASYKLTASSSGNANDLQPGSGPILSLYFSVPAGATEGLNPILFEPVNGIQAQFSDDCATITSPSLVAGAVTVCQNCGTCCLAAGDANHDTKVNIADVTFLITRIFAGGAAPFCQDEADANGDNSVNIGDVTYLISLIFAGGALPVCGTTGS
ncbi:MAG: choice-of-anchor B family protein, partial [Candidatus Zixiibacteriota bacterium]